MSKYEVKDFLGKTIGNVTVIENPSNPSKFLFQCKCGNIFYDEPSRIISGHKKSCGKCDSTNHPNYNYKSIRNEFIGKTFNLLKVIDFVKQGNQWLAKCECKCGKIKLVFPYQLKGGKVKSCGCIKTSSTPKNNKHSQSKPKNNMDGRTKNPLYGTWYQMIKRCENPNTIHYDRYGGRGIKVCEEWHDFWKFVEWSDSVGGRPDGFTIDRIDNDGDYEPSNCRWADNHTQAKNKNTCINVTHNGETKTLSEWAKELGLSDQAMYNRYHRGWNENDIFLQNQSGNNQFSGR